MPKRAIGYVRVSSVGGRSGPGYHTLDIQRASISATAKYRDYELVDVLTDEDESGKSRDRPRFREAMERVLDGEADAIVVWKVSRFSRNWKEAAEDVETLLDADKDLLSEEGFDTATAGGRLLLRILFSLANWEHDVLGEHWEVIKDKAVRDRGSHLGRAPTGYRHGGGGRLEPDPELGPVVARIFEQRAAGAGWAELVDMLDEVAPRPRGRRNRVNVQRIIANRVYLGEVRWRDQVNVDAHEPLVDLDLWQRANSVVTFEPERQPPRTRTRDFPVSGWLKCVGCERGMGGSVFRSRNREPIACYTCNGRRGGCPAPQSIKAEPVEKWLLEQAAEMYERLRVVADDDGDEELDRALAKIAETEAALHELASVDMRRELGDDWVPMMSRLRSEKAECEAIAIDRRRRLGVTFRDSVAWSEMDAEVQWSTLRRMAPDGVLVGRVAGYRDPVARLSFIVGKDVANAGASTELPE